MYNSSYNSFGQVGLIQIPTADSRPAGSVYFTFNNNEIWKYGTLTVSPFDWLEASYFYYRPSDLYWDDFRKRGQYLDKGFNVKFVYRSQLRYVPNIAIGLDDFAGSGYFSREYIVASQAYRDTKFTLGIGWGKFAAKNSFENPLNIITEKFSFRPEISGNAGQAGTPTTDQWFRGNVGIFGGIEHHIGQTGIKLKLEYDPFDYNDFSANNRLDAIYELRKQDQDLNFGISIPINEYLTVDASYIKGNTFNVSFNMGLVFNKPLSKKPKFDPKLSDINDDTKSKNTFYESLLSNLNNNSLFLQTANLDTEKNRLDISISTSNHRNAVRSSSYAGYVAKNVADQNEIDLSVINVRHINAGIQLNNIQYIANHLTKEVDIPVELSIRNTIIDSGHNNDYLQDEFQPIVEFPVIFSSLSPRLLSHVGYPAKFYFGGINLQYTSEIQFKRNLLLSIEINQPLYSNFDDAVSRPDSVMENVRTGLIEYLQEDDVYIGRIQLDYIWTPYKNMYAKITSGIFESMFGGIGGEILYKPFDKNFYLGAELFHVRQRSFNQRFNFQDYETSTGHINFGYKFNAGVEVNLSYGRYLAKDDGYTLDLARRTDSGFLAGIYFTRTNVSAETFGEGSFDKGFYFQFPLDFFSKEYTGEYSTFKLSPLTRDGGAKLLYDRPLRGLIYNSTSYEIGNQWNGFLD